MNRCIKTVNFTHYVLYDNITFRMSLARLLLLETLLGCDEINAKIIKEKVNIQAAIYVDLFDS